MSDFEDESYEENNKTYDINESDVEDDEIFGSDDYFGEDNEEYKKSYAFPVVKCPSSLEDNKKSFRHSSDKSSSSYFQFKPYNEKLITLENSDYDSIDALDLTIEPDTIISNYYTTYTLKFDYTLSKYDNFSKKHHREKLFREINEIDWDNEYKLRIAKKELNPYEEVFENYFDRPSSYRLANLNFIFKFNLFTVDRIIGFTPVLVVGDDGGYSDYILWQSQNYNFKSKIFAVPERNNKINKTKFRKEIESTRKDYLNIIDSIYPNNKIMDIDDIEGFKSSDIETLSSHLLEKCDGFGMSLFIARKVIKFQKEFSREIKYKKFLLLNIILGLNTLAKGGTMVIKVYDTFTPFTISLFYILYNSFEKITVIKPFSLRPHSSSRFIVCQKLLEFKPQILDYLKSFYDKYLELLKDGRDVEFIYPISKVIKDENFVNYVMEINSQISEQRIETIQEMKKNMEGLPHYKFDKMDLKKKCLDFWKIPVLHFNPNKLLSRSGDDKRGGSSKVTNIHETAKLMSEFNNYSTNMQSLVNMFDTPRVYSSHDSRHKRDNLHDDRGKQLTQKERDELFNKITQGKKKTKPRNKVDSNHIEMLKKKRNASLEQSELHNTMIEEKLSGPRESLSESELLRRRQMIIEETMRNRKLADSKRIQLDDNTKKELEKYKIKK